MQGIIIIIINTINRAHHIRELSSIMEIPHDLNLPLCVIEWESYVIPREGLDSLQNWGHRSADGGLWDASVPDLTLEGPGGQNSDS